MKLVLRILFGAFLFISKSYAQNNFEINFGTTAPDAGFSIRQTFDGSFIIAGSTESTVNFDEDVYLALLDSTGNVIWTKNYGGIGDESAGCVRQTPDSGFILTGVTDSYGNGFTDVYLIKTDKNGDTLWTKTFGGTEYDFGLSVENTLDGGFIISGQESSTNGGIANIYLIRTNAAGDSLWTKSYPMGAWTGATNVLQTPDSGFVIFGDYENNVTGTGDYDLYWMKLDASGNILSTRTYEDSVSHDYAETMRNTFDGGFIIASEKEPILTLDNIGSTLIRLDANLDTIWTKKCIYGFTYSVRDIVQSCDSGFIATGYIYDTLLSGNALFITKFNGNGDSLWNKFYYGLSSAGGYSIDNAFDDSIIVCGATIDTILGQSDVYVIKTENGGCGGNVCIPVITSQPLDSSVYENIDAEFTITAAIQSTAYQWQVDSTGVFLDLSDGGSYSGAATATLHVTGTLISMDGFQYRCVVQSPPNCSDTSNVAVLHVSIDPTLGISNLSGKKIVLYPNPVSNVVIISESVPEWLTIYDVYGKMIALYGSVDRIDVSSLPAGIYFLKAFNNNNTEFAIFRFIKN